MSEMIIQTKEGKNAYRLSPHGKGHTLCFEIEFWRDEYTDDKNEYHKGLWRPSGKYAQNIHDGLRTIAEDIERNGNWRAFAKANIKSLKEAAGVFEGLLDGFSVQVYKNGKEETD